MQRQRNGEGREEAGGGEKLERIGRREREESVEMGERRVSDLAKGGNWILQKHTIFLLSSCFRLSVFESSKKKKKKRNFSGGRFGFGG